MILDNIVADVAIEELLVFGRDGQESIGAITAS
jgi:hypothetical protein